MNGLKNLTRLGLATALLASMGVAGAATIGIGSASVPSASGGTVTVAITFNPQADVVAGYNTIIDYDNTILTGDPTVAPGGSAVCTIDPVTHTISVFHATFPASAIPSETACSVSFNVTAGTAVGAYPIAHHPGLPDTSFVDLAANEIVPAGTVTDGAINVVATGPGTISFPVAPVTLPNATYGTSTSANIPVNWAPGGGNNPGDTASFTCTAPAGFTVAPLSGGPYTNTGTPPANLAVSCTTGAAAVNGNVECTATNTAPSSANYTIPVTCPAGTMAPPNLTPNPASGSTLTVPSGAPGANSCQSFSIAATGGAGVNPATVTCSSADAAVVVTPATPLNFLPGAAAQSVQVCTTLTNAAQSFNNVVHCAGADGAGAIDWAFNVAAPAGAVAPTFVPASSLWSKLALFGMLGALGMLVIGLRRNH